LLKLLGVRSLLRRGVLLIGSLVLQPDLSDTFHFLYEEVESYLEEKKRNFNELVQKKRMLYSIEKEQAIA